MRKHKSTSTDIPRPQGHIAGQVHSHKVQERRRSIPGIGTFPWRVLRTRIPRTNWSGLWISAKSSSMGGIGWTVQRIMRCMIHALFFIFFIFIFFRFGQKPPNPKYVARAKRKEGSSGDRRQTWPPPPQYSVSPLKRGWESLFPRTGGRPLARGTRHAPPFHGGVPVTENSVGPASVPSNGVFIRPLGQGGILAAGLREGVQV